MIQTSGLLVNRIIEDRIQILFKLLKKYPIHKISKLYEEKVNVRIGVRELEDIYKVWRPDNHYALSTQITAAEKAECWKQVITRIQMQTSQDVADFLYHHWIQYQKRVKK